MKRKFMLLTLMGMIFFAFVSCDLLSTINAVKGFYTEYTEFSEIYNTATQYSVLTETQLTITDTNIEEMLPLDSRVYFMIDTESDFLYVEQNLQGINVNSLYEEVSGDLYVEYLIYEDNVVIARIPSEEQRFDQSTDADFVNSNFSYDDVENENKTGDRTYELDVLLVQAINIEALGDFIDELKVFDESLTALNDVVAHLVINFDSVDSTIDVLATVDNYQITFDDESTVTFSLNNHTVVKNPENFEMPDVFEDPYQIIAPSDVRLARRVFEANESVEYPGLLNTGGGWVQLNLEAGDYYIDEGDSNIVLSLYDDSAQTEIALVLEDITAGSYLTFEVTAAGTYYLFVTHGLGGIPIDFEVKNQAGEVVVTTTEQVTTEAETTTEVETTTEAETTTTAE
ncbi:MAG: hypothetical protein KAH13_03660 [Tenericutes bacterium]|nr:hypothetical protein [Mycoplasmatota bacterium]